MHRVEGFSSLSWFSSVLNRQKKPLDGKSGGKEGREAAGGGREWLLDFMFQLYVDGRGTVSNQHHNTREFKLEGLLTVKIK